MRDFLHDKLTAIVAIYAMNAETRSYLAFETTIFKENKFLFVMENAWHTWTILHI